jgi:CDP-diacylglycerol--serine O-phosphatidyltransferase
VSAFIWSASEWHEPGLPGLLIAFSVTACAGALMVSRFSFNSFKQFNLEGPVKFATFIAVPLVFVAIAAWPPTSLLVVFGGYALSGPLTWLYRRLRRPHRPVPAEGNG